jgi:hypothetical protein
MSDTLTGMVRSGVGGEHPTLGRLTPGQVLEVPAGMWSDALFAPVESGSEVSESLPVVRDEVIIGLDDRIREAETAIDGLEVLQREAGEAVAKVPAMQSAIDTLRVVARRVRERQAAIERRRGEIVAELAAMRRDLATDLLAAESAAQALAAVMAPPVPVTDPPAPVVPAIEETPAPAEIPAPIEEPVVPAEG